MQDRFRRNLFFLKQSFFSVNFDLKGGGDGRS